MPDLEQLCRNCGQCCYIEIGKVKKPCPNLVFEEGKSKCKIYTHRLGTKVGCVHNQAVYCVPRLAQGKLYPSCPYNEFILLKKKDRQD